jgi:hypothetical protein
MKILLSVLVSAALIGCSSSSEKNQDAAGGASTEASWSENMRSLMKTMSELLPLVHRKEEFQKAENRKFIEDSTEKLSKLSHNINSRSLPPETDPAIGFMAQQFAQDMQRTREALAFGQMEYARLSLRNITGYCIACHTRHGDGTKFPAQVFNSKVSNLNDMEKAEFYTATRQFDLATQFYQKALTDTRAPLKPLEWEQAAREALALEVRVKRSPEGTMLVIDDIAKSTKATGSIKEDAVEWRKAVTNWMEESGNRRTRLLKVPPAKQIKLAEHLVASAQRRQKYPMDRAGDIEFLRASDILHTALSQGDLKDKEQAQALYLAGVSTEALRDLSFWTMHETLYELCVQKAPKSAFAKKCYQRLEASLTGSYSGSSGTNLPAEVAGKLRELKSKLKK